MIIAGDLEAPWLQPLAQRYGRWLRMDRAAVEQDRDEAADDVRALQIVLRMERDAPPVWSVAVALAATASAAICLEPRSRPDGGWHEAVTAYCAGHIRKVVRRARGAPWEATAELPGLTFIDGPTQIRALVPGRVAELDKRLAKLQVGGTDVPPDSDSSSFEAARGNAPSDAPVGPLLRIWLPAEGGMSLGKAMAQAGHAGMIAAALLDGSDRVALAGWFAAGLTCAVQRLTEPAWLKSLRMVEDPDHAWTQDRMLAVRDAGFTEVTPGTITAVASMEVPSSPTASGVA